MLTVALALALAAAPPAKTSPAAERTITADASYTTPAAFEADYYRQTRPALEPVTQ